MASILSKNTLKRIVSDIKDIRQNPLTSHGIYYSHDETDLLKGVALIIGPKGTPYADGFYLFKFKFPENYPHTPPTVESCTQDNQTRFNPNLYRSGKVCLSILNTWKGEQWSGCQTLSSVLLAICTIFNEEPLLNEPGITKDHRDFEKYNSILRYKNISTAILLMMKQVKTAEFTHFAVFDDIMREHFQREKENIRERILNELSKTKDTIEIIEIDIYKLSVKIDYLSLLKQFTDKA